MKFILSCLLFYVAYTTTLAQPTSAARSFLETRFTQSIGPSDYTQFLRFADAFQPDGFSYSVMEGSHYAVYNVKLQQIKAIDIVSPQRDTAIKLVLTFRQPVEIAICDNLHGNKVATENRQTLALPLRNYREALHVQQALSNMDTMLDFRIRKQHADKSYPEMMPMPEIKARLVWLGKYPVTVQQYRTYCQAQQIPMPPAPAWGWHADHPMVGITWQEAKDYTLWLSQKTGQWFDLPAKQVWQYAALDNLEERVIDDVAWWGENAAESTQPVGQKLPNGFGLYDMQGNVWEWLDEPEDNKQRTAAGGSWDSHFAQCQWNSLTQLYPNGRDFSTGFRIVRYQR
ncbi:SUMF1/EgtB/PvdO family nonheme iron enzyme [Sphingobacterium sp. DN00404]|uniref:SUMF1/EgtB/PvdO family nonheme iron enzyme n=1 Tax=Sphingobacterium micropteri TaxID=2763501 RepID=A0ABR7YRH2_9SPHI|nr:formylglycine-generating enzyme family protein [Sphingobacterium micropteri]MBD1433931.1 SUMF1/EgtB/PvdO family nonheme iron enzyme [Sphingobacterium micropteri]